MLNLFRMDLRRLFRGKSFYLLILGLAVMIGTFAMTGAAGANTSIAALIGPVASGGGDMMSAMMGISMVLIFASLILTIFIGSDYSTGFAKNIFTVHAKKWDYILSKLLISIIVSAIYITFYVALMSVLGAIQGLPMGLPGGFGGLALFVLENLLLAVALNSIVILINVFFRNRVIGTLGCFLIGTGAISMLIGLLGGLLDWPFLNTLATFSVAGCGMICSLVPRGMVFLQVVIVSVVWTALALYLSYLTLKKKDLKS